MIITAILINIHHTLWTEISQQVYNFNTNYNSKETNSCKQDKNEERYPVAHSIPVSVDTAEYDQTFISPKTWTDFFSTSLSPKPI